MNKHEPHGMAWTKNTTHGKTWMLTCMNHMAWFDQTWTTWQGMTWIEKHLRPGQLLQSCHRSSKFCFQSCRRYYYSTQHIKKEHVGKQGPVQYRCSAVFCTVFLWHLDAKRIMAPIHDSSIHVLLHNGLRTRSQDWRKCENKCHLGLKLNSKYAQYCLYWRCAFK